MRRSLGRSWSGGPGGGQKRGQPQVPSFQPIWCRHTHTAGSVNPNSKFSGGDSPGKFPALAGLREKEAQASPTKEHYMGVSLKTCQEHLPQNP